MNDNEKKPPPDAKPLEYWHSRELPDDSARLVASFCAGFVLWAFVVLLVGGFWGSFYFSIHPTQRIAIPQMIILTWCGLFVASVVMLFRFSRTHRELSIEDRRRPARFFRLGSLIGIGVAALLCGFCFTSM